jgi:hypothetical protein
MADGMSIQADGKEILDMLDRLSGPEMKKVELMALRSSANILKKKTDENFLKTGLNIPMYKKETITRKKTGKQVTKIRRVATVRVKVKDLLSLVHIMSNYLIPWFEFGTNERHTQGYQYRTEENKVKRKVGRWGFFYQRKGKGRRTGRIKPHWFFKLANDQTEQQIFSNIKNELSKAIIKIANKKGRK